jgi:hypothetical protein
MATSKNIRVVLTLDDNGFTAKGKSAQEVLKLLNSDLRTSAEQSQKLEKALADLAKPLASNQKLLKDIATTSNQTVSELQNIAREVSNLAKGLTDLNAQSAPVAKGMADVQKNANAVGVSMAQMKPSLAAAAQGFKDLGAASSAATRQMKDDAGTRESLRLRELQQTIATNDKILESKAKLHAELRKLESDTRMQAMAAQQKAAAGRTPNGQFMSAADKQALNDEAARLTANADLYARERAALDTLIPQLRAEQQARRDNVVAMQTEQAERERLATIAAYVGQKNADEVARVQGIALQRQKDADREAAESARQSYAQRVAFARSAHEEEMAYARQMMEMWKALGQLYAASKIEQGLKASVGQAADMQAARVKVQSLNLGDAATQEFFIKSADLTRTDKFLSQLDAINTRLSMLQALGYNDVQTMDATIDHIAKAANNMERLGLAHGDFQTTVRNVMALSEVRGQTANPEAVRGNADLLQRIAIGTGGKINVQDIETVLRRFGPGATKLSDTGIANFAGLADMMKVAGGDGGGSGSGVSTVGTALKMLQAYALGKALPGEQAVKELGGANILNLDNLDLSSKAGIKNAKSAGFQNMQKWVEDPVGAMQELFPKIAAYIKSHPTDFGFKNGQQLSDEEIENGFQIFLRRLGVTVSAQQAAVIAGSPETGERLRAQTQTIQNSAGVDEVANKLEPTFNQQLTEAQARLHDLGITIGSELLPPLNKVLETVQEIFGWFNSFAQENPLVTQILTLGTVVLGAYAGVSGLMKLFGMQGLWGVLKGVAGEFPTLLAGLGSVAESVGLAGGAFGAFIAFLTKGAVTIAAGTFALAVGYAIGKWIGDIDAGGLTINQHIQNYFTQVKINVLTTFQEMADAWAKTVSYFQTRWMELKSFFGADVSKDRAQAEYDKARAKIISEHDKQALKILEQSKNQPILSGISDADAKRELKNMQDMAAAQRQMGDAVKAANAHVAEQAKLLAARRRTGGAPPAFGGTARTDHSGDLNIPTSTRTPRTPREFVLRDPREHVDPLDKALEEEAGKLAADQIKMKGILTDSESLDAMRQQALEKLEGKRKAGDFNLDHDRRNQVSAEDPRYLQLQKDTEAAVVLEAQIKALTYGNERLSAATSDADNAMARLTGANSSKESQALQALERDFARLEQRMGGVTKGLTAYNAIKQQALFERRLSDSANFFSQVGEQNKDLEATLLPTQIERTMAKIDADQAKYREQSQRQIDGVKEQAQAAIDALNQQLAADQSYGAERVLLEQRIQDQIKSIREQADREQTQAQDAQNERLRIMAEERARALEQPVYALARAWKDTDAQLRQAQTRWMDGFVDMLVDGIGKGKLQFKQFAESVLSDILKIQLHKSLADPLSNIIGSGVDSLRNGLFGDTREGLNAGIANMKGFDEDRAADQATQSLQKLATDGADQATQALTNNVTQMGTQLTANEAATTSLTALASAANSASGAMMAMGGGAGLSGLDAGLAADMSAGFFELANGGVLTREGMVPLRRYAAGGIARSPQLALYGEAGPEAYVPLPDGRSIPVNMAGGGAPQIQVNVINQSGMPLSAQQQGVQFDGKKAILDVVVSAASSPGPFRDSMKQALRG